MYRKPTKEAELLGGALQKLGIRVLSEVGADGHKHVDLGIPDALLNIEVDGEHHLTDAYQILNDLSRDHFSELAGYETIRVSNNAIHTNLGAIASAIAEAAKIREERIRQIRVG